MTEGTHFVQMDVNLSELTEDMLIISYTGFEDKYRPMDDKTCKWVKLNFKGASTVVERSGNKKAVPVEETDAGDTLCLIEKLPSSLINISQVNKKLISELRERGFLRFKVQKAASASLPRKQDLGKAIDQANLFVKKVKESVQLCSHATEAVENLMDNARQGKTDIAEIKNQVDSITKDNSSEAISAIISLKENDQVYAHCIDVAVVFQTAYTEIVRNNGLKSVFKDEKEIMLAAFLHDIGKAKVPKEILDSTAPFKRNSREMQLIRTHPETGAQLLQSMGMPDYFCDMAHHHHVKFDHTMASSYPQGVEYKSILFETKLLALVDAYQALTAGRSYKKSWTPPAVMRYLDATAGVEFDLNLWQDFQKVMGHYPRGSFVKLSDGTYGFVISVPNENVLKPQVVVVRNASNQDLTKQYLIDLQIELDITISQDIDVNEIYGDKALEIFTNLSVS
jgi:putative nucleotidyltransferase with HDIG domain